MIWFNVILILAVIATVAYGFYNQAQTRALWRKVYEERNETHGRN